MRKRFIYYYLFKLKRKKMTILMMVKRRLLFCFVDFFSLSIWTLNLMIMNAKMVLHDIEASSY
jgi:hypothetical protein